MSNNYPSPDGLFAIETSSNEMRMSHWIEEPTLVRTSDQATLFNLYGSLWSVDATSWSDDSAFVTLDMRRYPGRLPPVKLVLYPSENRAVVFYFDEKVLETDGMGRALRVSYHSNGKTFEGDLLTVENELRDMKFEI